MSILDSFKSLFRSSEPAPVKKPEVVEESLPEKEPEVIKDNSKQDNLDALIFALRNFMQQNETEEVEEKKPEEKRKFIKLADFLRNS